MYTILYTTEHFKIKTDKSVIVGGGRETSKIVYIVHRQNLTLCG